MQWQEEDRLRDAARRLCMAANWRALTKKCMRVSLMHELCIDETHSAHVKRMVSEVVDEVIPQQLEMERLKRVAFKCGLARKIRCSKQATLQQRIVKASNVVRRFLGTTEPSVSVVRAYARKRLREETLEGLDGCNVLHHKRRPSANSAPIHQTE